METILLAEELILENERAHYADTRAMRTSLDNALTEINAALTLVEKVQNPAAYKSVTDDYYQTIKSRIGRLPKDEARQFFKSHRSRLENLEKARLMGIDKELIGVRKKNLGEARASYIELQEMLWLEAIQQQNSSVLCSRNTQGRSVKKNDGPSGIRTLDLGIKSPLLYQLS